MKRPLRALESLRALKAGHRAATALALAATVAVGATLWSGAASGAAPNTAPNCRTSQLMVWRGEPGDGVAGGTYYELQFSNVSKTTCALVGFPGISAVNRQQHQLGSPATWDHMFPPSRVVLTPGTTAHAVLRITDVGVYSPSQCQPTTAAGLRIYPPNQTSAVFMPFSFQACSKAGTPYLSVRTIRPRAGIPGFSQ